MARSSAKRKIRLRGASSSIPPQSTGPDAEDSGLAGLSLDFRVLFESWPGAYLVLDPELMIIAVSDAHLAVSMTSRSDVMGKHISQAFPDNPDDPESDGEARLRASLDRVRRHKVADTMPVQQYDIRRHGSEEFETRFWSVVNSPVLDHDGNLLYIVNRAEDITEYIRLKERQARRQPVEEKLQAHVDQMEAEILARALDLQVTNRELRRLAAIVEYADDAILTKTLTGIITSWNAGAEKLYGYTEQEVLGKPVSMLVPPRYNDEVPAMLREIVSTRKAMRSDSVRIRKDGTTVDVSLALSPIFDAAGEVIEVAAISRDITERKRTEKSLAERSRQLETSNEELEQYAYVASHDLQEPLRKMASFCQLLARRYQGQLDEQADEFIAYIVDGARRMQEMINDLLTFSRVGRSAEMTVEVDCNQVVERALVDLAAADRRERSQHRGDRTRCQRCEASGRGWCSCSRTSSATGSSFTARSHRGSKSRPRPTVPAGASPSPTTASALIRSTPTASSLSSSGCTAGRVPGDWDRPRRLQEDRRRLRRDALLRLPARCGHYVLLDHAQRGSIAMTKQRPDIPIEILLVEDDPGNVLLTQEALNENKYHITIQRCG